MTHTILITGASSGIGKATARLFAERGWNVVATMRNTDDGADLAHDNILVTRLDLVDNTSIASAFAAGMERFGSIDVLLNNAGYGAYGPLEATPMDTIRHQFEVNFFGLIEATKAAMPIMRAQKAGIIINISSVGGRMTYPLGTLYHSSKYAVEGLSEALHYELWPLGLRVKIIEPGGVKTDFGGRSFEFTTDPNLTDYQPMVDAMTTAMADMDTSSHQEPADVAEVIWNAATDGSDQIRYVSGDGAASLLSGRYDLGQDEAFVAGLRKNFGL